MQLLLRVCNVDRVRTIQCSMQFRHQLHTTGADPGGGRLGLSTPPKTYKSNFLHHDFVQFGKTLDCQILLKSPSLNLRAGSVPGMAAPQIGVHPRVRDSKM